MSFHRVHIAYCVCGGGEGSVGVWVRGWPEPVLPKACNCGDSLCKGKANAQGREAGEQA